jgi:hypothetical protein
MEKLLPLMVVLAAMLGIVGISALAVRWARKSSRRAAFLGWGLQFLGAGVNPVPAALRDRDSESGRYPIPI